MVITMEEKELFFFVMWKQVYQKGDGGSSVQE